MLKYISNTEALLIECEKMQQFLEVSVTDDLNEIVERGNDMSVIIARSGKMLSDAKYLQDQAVKRSILQILKENKNITASIAKQLIDTSCSTENYLVSWLDRMNRTATHQMDWLRSVLSKGKEEIRMMNYNK